MCLYDSLFSLLFLLVFGILKKYYVNSYSKMQDTFSLQMDEVKKE